MVLCPYVQIILRLVNIIIFMSLESQESETIYYYLQIVSNIWPLCTIIHLLYHKPLRDRIFFLLLCMFLVLI